MNSKNPNFSVVIPTYNRPQRLKECLDSLVQLDYLLDDVEVIIVDDGSDSPLEDIFEPYTKHGSFRLIRQANAGPASARNAGAAAARGKYLVFTDDDCRPEADWLNALAQQLEKTPHALIGGYTINDLPHNYFSSASQMLIDYLYGYFNKTKEKRKFFASNNFAVPRNLFLQSQGFDVNFPLAAGEDREFCDRWQHLGHDLVFAPTMRIRHAHFLTLKTFWKQHFNYGRGAFYFHQVRSQRQRQSLQVEPIGFYWQLLAYPFRQGQGQGAQSLAISGLLLISQIANATGFFWEKRHHSIIRKSNSPEMVQEP